LDHKTTFQELKKEVAEFRDKRNWNRYHNPKDLAIGLSTEANELLAHFRFKTEQDMKEMVANTENFQEIKHELADVMFFVLLLSHDLDIDIAESFRNKREIDAKKYPIKQCDGKNLKYTKYKEK